MKLIQTYTSADIEINTNMVQYIQNDSNFRGMASLCEQGTSQGRLWEEKEK
jgi:hypothetical protein